MFVWLKMALESFNLSIGIIIIFWVFFIFNLTQLRVIKPFFIHCIFILLISSPDYIRCFCYYVCLHACFIFIVLFKKREKLLHWLIISHAIQRKKIRQLFRVLHLIHVQIHFNLSGVKRKISTVRSFTSFKILFFELNLVPLGNRLRSCWIRLIQCCLCLTSALWRALVLRKMGI